MGTGDYAFKAENIQQIRQLVEKKQVGVCHTENTILKYKAIREWYKYIS